MRAMNMLLAIALTPAAMAQPPADGGGRDRVILAIVGTGTVHTPPDTVTLRLTVTGSGSTPQEARADRDRRIAETKSRLGAIGINGPAIETETSVSDTIVTMPPIAPPAGRPQRAQQSLVLTLPGLAQVQKVRDAIGTDDIATPQTPVLKLRDTAPAHRQAVAAAVANARAEADAYAASLGLTVTGIAKVSNSVGVSAMLESLTQGLRPNILDRPTAAQDVTTDARVEIDFVARPR